MSVTPHLTRFLAGWWRGSNGEQRRPGAETTCGDAGAEGRSRNRKGPLLSHHCAPHRAASATESQRKGLYPSDDGRVKPCWGGAVASGLFVLLGLFWARSRPHAARAHRLEWRDGSARSAEFARLAQEMAHEVRNPLTAINARLYKLQKRFPAGTPEHRETSIIEAEIKRLDQMLEDFRRLGRASHGQYIAFPGSELIAQVRDLFAPQLAPLSIELCIEADPKLRVFGDPLQLKQVLVNLTKNAIESILERREHAPSERQAPGLLALRLRPGWGRRDQGVFPAVVIEVVDNGVGIRKELRARLLDPFFSTKEHGTGLGLPITARIVAEHGGMLEFESERQQTTFRVILPAAVGGAN